MLHAARGSGGVYDLSYAGDYPDGYSTFAAEEPMCRAKGDLYCEFLATKSHHPRQDD